MRVWILVEEAESSSFADGETYCVISVHATKQSAERAEAEWREEHETRTSSGPHAFVRRSEDEDYWCDECSTGLAVHEMEVTE